MTRIRTSILGKVGPPIAASLAGLLLVGLGLFYASRVSAGSTTEVLATVNVGGCYAWEARNTTGADADSLRIELSGVPTVTQVYAGDANPLGGPSAGSGYDAASDRYTLVLGPNGSTIGPDDSVHVGVCTPQAVTAASYQWFAAGNALQSGATLPLVSWDWQGADTVHLQLKNTTGMTITLLSLQLLDPETALDPADLGDAVAAQLSPFAVVLDEPAELAPGSAISSTLAMDVDPLGPAKPVVVAAQWSDTEDLAAANTFYAQTNGQEPGRIYLPSIKQ